jgi:hypothetical protein
MTRVRFPSPAPMIFNGLRHHHRSILSMLLLSLTNCAFCSRGPPLLGTLGHCFMVPFAYRGRTSRWHPQTVVSHIYPRKHLWARTPPESRSGAGSEKNDGPHGCLLNRPRRVWTAGHGYSRGYCDGSRELLAGRTKPMLPLMHPLVAHAIGILFTTLMH